MNGVGVNIRLHLELAGQELSLPLRWLPVGDLMPCRWEQWPGDREQAAELCTRYLSDAAAQGAGRPLVVWPGVAGVGGVECLSPWWQALAYIMGGAGLVPCLVLELAEPELAQAVHGHLLTDPACDLLVPCQLGAMVVDARLLAVDLLAQDERAGPA